jgi:hypothetical protein
MMLPSKTAWDQSEQHPIVRMSKVRSRRTVFSGKQINRRRIDDGCEARVSKLVFVRLRNQNRCDPDATLQDF